ncbi:hypothetical protein GIB67_001224 [Kingdonia uniflora]|uniref:WAT1-related protein n=1 Tax=Kingdonia uniflora TaxID=39325 RepID=A0A7J7LGG1_9MAGN|nr:hypothetical protein GIB67_001224 [Kingdonia uniflora]
MFGVSTLGFAEEFGVVGGLTTVQFLYAIYGVFSSHLMTIGLTPLFLIVHASFATSIFLLPLTVVFERNKWPGMSLKMLSQFVLIAFGGVTMFQVLMLIGIEKTSPAVASAMPNLAPGLIFVIAWALRFENVKLKCIYSRVKILGTLICIAGAITMSFLHTSTATRTQLNVTTVNNDKIIGTMCLMVAVIILSFTVVLQASTLVEFPAPLTLCTITAFIGAILTGIVQLIQEQSFQIGSPFLSVAKIAGYSLLGGAMNGACTSFQSWVIQRRGPVFTSTFSPIGTVFAVILSALFLGEAITLGSLFGMFLMFTGLYFVLWAKKKEDFLVEDIAKTPKDFDVEKPLLR